MCRCPHVPFSAQYLTLEIIYLFSVWNHWNYKAEQDTSTGKCRDTQEFAAGKKPCIQVSAAQEVKARLTMKQVFPMSFHSHQNELKWKPVQTATELESDSARTAALPSKATMLGATQCCQCHAGHPARSSQLKWCTDTNTTAKVIMFFP